MQKRLVEDLQAEKAKREKDAEQRAETVEDLKKDLAGKTEEYMQTVNVLKLKQVLWQNLFLVILSKPCP